MSILSWKGLAKSRDVEKIQHQSDVFADALNLSIKAIEDNAAEAHLEAGRIMDAIASLQKELGETRKELGVLHGETQSIKVFLESSQNSAMSLLNKLNENKLTKDDMETIASFLRFIAANQLLLEGRLCGEESAAVNDSAE